MTGTIADMIRAELSDELKLTDVRFLRPEPYAREIQVLTGGGGVTLGPDVVGGYVGRGRYIPVRSTEISFDVMYNLREAFAK